MPGCWPLLSHTRTKCKQINIKATTKKIKSHLQCPFCHIIYPDSRDWDIDIICEGEESLSWTPTPVCSLITLHTPDLWFFTHSAHTCGQTSTLVIICFASYYFLLKSLSITDCPHLLVYFSLSYSLHLRFSLLGILECFWCPWPPGCALFPECWDPRWIQTRPAVSAPLYPSHREHLR